MKIQLFIGVLLALSACQNKEQKEQTLQDSPATAPITEASSLKVKTYFAVTSWTTKDRKDALEHIPNQQKQLMGLWNKGIVENVYYNQKGKFNDGEPLSLIAFFIKGTSEDAVRSILDTTDIVKNSLASYTLREVGDNLFSRNENAVKLSGHGIETYAVVWSLIGNKADRDTANLSKQAEMTNKLNEVGIIENGYIDKSPSGSKTNDMRPAVFFINAKSQADAKRVLDTLPIVKSKQASYGLHDVGQFFIGIKTM